MQPEPYESRKAGHGIAGSREFHSCGAGAGLYLLTSVRLLWVRTS